jgi:hypothetical protein
LFCRASGRTGRGAEDTAKVFEIAQDWRKGSPLVLGFKGKIGLLTGFSERLFQNSVRFGTTSIVYNFCNKIFQEDKMKTKFFMLMILISAVYVSGQEQNSQTIIGEWLQIERDDDELVVIIFTDSQMTMRQLLYNFSIMTIGCTVNNGTVVLDDGNSFKYSLADNDTLSIEVPGELGLMRTFKRLYQDLSLNGIFYENDGEEFNDYDYIEFVDGQRGKRNILGFILPFKYEIHGIYLTIQMTEEYENETRIFIIKSDSIIEDHEGYGGFGQGTIYRKKD